MARESRAQNAREAALSRIAACRRNGDTVLSLANLGLEELPAEIGQLTALTGLDLSSNPLLTLTAEIGQLTALTTLDVSDCQLSTLPAEIGHLKALTNLNLRDNRLTALPKEIGQLQVMVRLRVGYNQLGALPPEIGQLGALTTLSLSVNQLVALPPEIGQLGALTTLYLFGNRLGALPPEIGQLGALTTLDLFGNQLVALPPEIGQLGALTTLNLSGNQLGALPPEIGQLGALTTLYLYGNQLGALPPEIGQLGALTRLYLFDNQLGALPRTFRGLSQLEALFLHDNPKLGLPTEVLGPTSREANKDNPPANPADILDYYFRADRLLLEARIIVIGDGEVGKTSLIRQLLHDSTARQQEETTRDVVIKQWMPILRAKQVQVNVWDFGGQEPMHAAHPYFFTERTLYLVVASARESGVEERLGYWLRMVAAHGSGARVLAVVNKTDQHPMDLDRRGLCKDHPALPENPAEAFHATSCTTGAGIAELKQAIQRELTRMDQIWERTPSTWFEVKARVGAMREKQEDTLDFSVWRSICEDAGIAEENERDRLLDLLRALGLVVSFPNVTELRPLGVLNPEWVTRAIYPLLTCPELAQSGGLLKIEDLPRLLNPKRYPRERHSWLVGLLKKFELLFADESGRLLLPARLPKETPEWALAPEWDGPAVLRLEMRYPVLPESIISRFIVRMHQDARVSGAWWRHGIALRDGGCEALVRALVTDGRLELRVRGPKTQRQHFIGRLRGQLHDLGRAFGGGELYVVLAEGLAEKYTDLLLLAEAGETEIKRTVNGRVMTFELAPLLDLIETAGQRKATAERLTTINKYYMGEGDHIEIGGNATGSALGRGNRVRNDRSFNTMGVTGEELTRLFQTLNDAVSQVRPEMRVKDAEALEAQLVEFEAEAKKPEPDKSRLTLTGKGLIEAAKTVGEMAAPVLGAVGEILKFYGVSA